MPANPWELRADVRPLDTAAEAWREVAEVMTRRGDEIVDAARRATEGWEAAAAEGYEQHRRRVLAHLDAFTTLAGDLAGSLQAISAVLTSAQKELDRSWLQVATVPHESVGESRHLVFHPADEQHHGTVARCRREAEEIRGRLRVALELERGRLRAAGAELVVVRTGLTELAAGRFPGGWGSGGEPGAGVPGVAPTSTSVRGSAQAGVGALPPMAPISSVSVDMPDLAGISPAAVSAASAAAAAGRRRPAAKGDPATGTPPVGGMGAGAVGARAGAMSRGGTGGRAGARRMAAPRLEGPGAGAGAGRGTGGAAEADAEARKQAEKDAKRALLEEKRAERAARRARREAEGRDDRDEPGPDGPEERTEDDLEGDEAPGVVTVVHDAPGEEPEEQRR